MTRAQVFIVAALGGACSQPPQLDPWCDCDTTLAGVALHVSVKSIPIEGMAPFIPQQVRVTVRRGGEAPIESLATELSNDGVNLGDDNVRLARRADGQVELRLSGWKQEPACFRLEATTLRFRDAPCAPQVTPLACRYAKR
jgi:hypothetical protein